MMHNRCQHIPSHHVNLIYTNIIQLFAHSAILIFWCIMLLAKPFRISMILLTYFICGQFECKCVSAKAVIGLGWRDNLNGQSKRALDEDVNSRGYSGHLLCARYRTVLAVTGACHAVAIFIPVSRASVAIYTITYWHGLKNVRWCCCSVLLGVQLIIR